MSAVNSTVFFASETVTVPPDARKPSELLASAPYRISDSVRILAEKMDRYCTESRSAPVNLRTLGFKSAIPDPLQEIPRVFEHYGMVRPTVLDALLFGFLKPVIMVNNRRVVFLHDHFFIPRTDPKKHRKVVLAYFRAAGETWITTEQIHRHPSPPSRYFFPARLC